MSKAPLRDVVRAFETEGPRGGRELVHVLECGCLVINRRRTPAKRLRCISCDMLARSGIERPRPEDIAWQAFQAGVTYGRSRITDDLLAELADSKPEDDGFTRLQKVFREWWSRR